MALSTKKYLYIFFLVSPISLSLYAQSSAIEKPAVSDCTLAAIEINQNNESADKCISKLDNSNQLIVGLSTPKDSLTMSADLKDQSSDCEENSLIGSTSILAKDIIENYKYDFSETFIDILFFERIDLARTRTI
ncbi:hypothetical protein SAMN05444671_3241 [Flavobacterium sp. CF108]|uniref:hypothetical protein n=1 Tax=unclassified Flavobacterium TaxID=196869 RepID=UPI0008BE6736|nr:MULTISPECIES: hypothetical protein [unclassified Flavobacterium]SEP27698.1 hypothetical protein SAMN04487978_0315 [Flavobacterium sp. fv08]SHH58265.1 hypothetical protein SAMN05444671_3241 [Flavobacterium sp. CF108]